MRRRALWGQLLMIGVGGGLTVAGVVISSVGFTSVFVPTDLDFMGTHADHLRAADPHLLPFIAHDRAGSGERWWALGWRCVDQHVGVAARAALGVVVSATGLCVRDGAGPHRSLRHRLHPFRAPGAGLCAGGGNRHRPRSVQGLLDGAVGADSNATVAGRTLRPGVNFGTCNVSTHGVKPIRQVLKQDGSAGCRTAEFRPGCHAARL